MERALEIVLLTGLLWALKYDHHVSIGVLAGAPILTYKLANPLPRSALE